jgi:hypothetical protein
MASGKAVSWCQNGAEGFRHFSRSNVSWSQELIELGKFCNGLASLKGSENRPLKSSQYKSSRFVRELARRNMTMVHWRSRGNFSL